MTAVDGSASRHKRAVRRLIEAGRSWPFVAHTPGGMIYDWRVTKCIFEQLRSAGARELPRNSYRVRWRNWIGRRRLARAMKTALED